MLVYGSDNLSAVQKFTMLDNVFESVTSLKPMKTQTDQFKSQTDTELIYEQYSEIFFSCSTNYDNKFKQDYISGSKYWYNV